MKWIVLLCALLCGCNYTEDDMDPFSNELMAYKGGWSQGDNLSYLGTGPVLQVGPFDHAHDFTVQFQVTGSLRGGGNIVVPPNPVAELSWTTNGNTIKRKVSIANGVSVSGLGSYLNVNVRDLTLSDTVLTGNYQVLILCSPGSRPSQNQPATYLTSGLAASFSSGVPVGGLGFVTLNALGDFADVQIPRDAGVISVFTTAGITGVTPSSPSDVAIGLLTSNSTDGNTKLFDAGLSTWIPVGATAEFLRLQNVNPANTPVIVSFTWGIDG